jgi:hypothetical protein
MEKIMMIARNKVERNLMFGCFSLENLLVKKRTKETKATIMPTEGRYILYSATSSANGIMLDSTERVIKKQMIPNEANLSSGYSFFLLAT